LITGGKAAAVDNQSILEFSVHGCFVERTSAVRVNLHPGTVRQTGAAAERRKSTACRRKSGFTGTWRDCRRLAERNGDGAGGARSAVPLTALRVFVRYRLRPGPRTVPGQVLRRHLRERGSCWWPPPTHRVVNPLQARPRSRRVCRSRPPQSSAPASGGTRYRQRHGWWKSRCRSR
jgi:hypothetical protein